MAQMKFGLEADLQAEAKAKEDRRRFDEGRVVSLPVDEALTFLANLMHSGQRFTVDAARRPRPAPGLKRRVLIAKVTDC